MTLRIFEWFKEIELFLFECDSKIEPFVEYDWKNWTLFANVTKRIERFLKT